MTGTKKMASIVYFSLFVLIFVSGCKELGIFKGESEVLYEVSSEDGNFAKYNMNKEGR